MGSCGANQLEIIISAIVDAARDLLRQTRGKKSKKKSVVIRLKLDARSRSLRLSGGA